MSRGSRVVTERETCQLSSRPSTSLSYIRPAPSIPRLRVTRPTPAAPPCARPGPCAGARPVAGGGRSSLSLARAARGPARGWCDTCVWKCIQQVALFWDRTLPGLLSHLGHGDDYMLHRGPGRHVAGGHWVVAGGLHFSSQPSALPAPSSKSPGTKVGG